jgi:hypothetical protein
MELGGPTMARILRTTATPVLGCASYRQMSTRHPATNRQRACLDALEFALESDPSDSDSNNPVSALEDFLAPRSSHGTGVFGLG